MPRLNEALLDCVVYLYNSEEDAQKGAIYSDIDQMLPSGGSGFLVAVRFEQYPAASIYVVTNRHVIAGGAVVVRINTHDGFDIVSTAQDDWIDHPDGDDVTICPIGGLDRSHHDFDCVDSAKILDRQMLDEYDIGLGDETFFVGRFVNHEGKQRNLPTLRFGTLAMMPWEPVRSASGFLQESFLVEAHSLPGYSGSPVFVFDNPPYPRRGNQHFWGPFLLGIDWGHLHRFISVVDDDKRTPTDPRLYVRENTGMMAVVPGWKLLDVLNREDVVKVRQHNEAQWLEEHQGQPQVEEDMAAGEQPYAREDFLRDLRRVTRRVEPESDQESGEK